MRLRCFLLATCLAIAPCLAAHASTITDDITLSYSVYGIGQSLTFSLPEVNTVTTNDYSVLRLPVQVTDTTGSKEPRPGELFIVSNQLFLDLYNSSGNVTVAYNLQLSSFYSRTLLSDDGGHGGDVQLVLLPGEYNLAYGRAYLAVDTSNASTLTLTDVTLSVVQQVAPEPMAVTPEPSTIALLGTGVLSAVAVVRRRPLRT